MWFSGQMTVWVSTTYKLIAKATQTEVINPG